MASEIKVTIPDDVLETLRVKQVRGVPREEYLNSRIQDGGDGCWNWAGEIINKGYGRLRWGGRRFTAHRLIYELVKGPIPAGLQLDHLCRNRRCVNPEHLEPVTASENVSRGDSSLSRRSGLCKNGLHDITQPGNVYLGGGRKTCYPCRRVSMGLSEVRVRAKQDRVAYLS